MIFLTLGTHQPFDRLVSAVDRWCGCNADATVIGQIPEPGPNGFRPRHFEWVSWMSPAEYERHVTSADFIVAHAGMGSIIAAQTFGKLIVIMPRRAALNEQRNDHQLATVERFRNKPGIFAALNEAELHDAMSGLIRTESERSYPVIEKFADQHFVVALRSAILSAEAGKL